MADEGHWRELPLEDCMAAIIDYRGKSPEKTASGVPLVTAKIVKNGRIETPEEFIASEAYDSWMRRGLPERGDVVVTTEAPLGEVAMLDGTKVALAQRIIALRANPEILSDVFLKFLMQSEYVQAQLRSRATGTTVLGIKQSELRRIALRLPPLATQRAIGRVLGVLDDKIELNRKTNATLEAMARALFKSWFVDFDPVRAKSEGRAPDGMGSATAKVFPSEFISSRLGRIPSGWIVGSVGDLVELKRGTTYKGTLVGAPGPALLGLGSIRPGGGFRSDGFKTYGGECPPELMLAPGDIYVSLKGATKDGEMIGSVARVPTSVPSGRLTQDTVKLQLRDPLWGTALYRLLLTPEYRAYCAGRATGSAVVALSRDDFLSYSMPLPPRSVLQSFNAIVHPLDMRMEHNDAECTVLESVRDALLPRLLSGELAVSDAEAIA